MEIYSTHLGNTDDPAELPADLDPDALERVRLSANQRRRSRVRIETSDGHEIGIVVGREIRSGDVLESDGLEPSRVVVELEPVEALRVDLAEATGRFTTAVALGHAAGNRHWSMAIEGDAVLFPATATADRMVDTVESHLPPGASVEWRTVPPETFDDANAGHSHEH